MALIHKRPLIASQRFYIQNKPEVAKKRPEKDLIEIKKRSGGRNCYGRLTSPRRGGGHKRFIRTIDYKRQKYDVPAKVEAIEYDPNRSALIALLAYADGERRYMVAPNGLSAGDTVLSSRNKIEYKVGYAMPLKHLPPAVFIHAIELIPGRGARIARAAGNAAQLMAVEGDKATIRMPSGEIRLVNSECLATLGTVGNADHQNRSLGKAGRHRWMGFRPRTRGMKMNPVDHPNGGGQGKSKGGGGRQQLVSPWGQLAKGFPTRTKSKPSNSQILVRRNGRKVKS